MAEKTKETATDIEQHFKGMRRRMALLTGLVVADTAILIVLMIMVSAR